MSAIPEKEMAQLTATCRNLRRLPLSCAAGVDIQASSKRAGAALTRAPCLTGAGAWSCERYERTPAEDVEKEWGPVFAEAEKFVQRIARGKCGHCGAEVVERQRVGRCVYALPCGHRQGQYKEDGDGS